MSETSITIDGDVDYDTTIELLDCASSFLKKYRSCPDEINFRYSLELFPDAEYKINVAVVGEKVETITIGTVE